MKDTKLDELTKELETLLGYKEDNFTVNSNLVDKDYNLEKDLQAKPIDNYHDLDKLTTSTLIKNKETDMWKDTCTVLPPLPSLESKPEKKAPIENVQFGNTARDVLLAKSLLCEIKDRKDADQKLQDTKQDTLIAGANIVIQDNVISAFGEGIGYKAGDGIDITNYTISADNTIARLTDLKFKVADTTIEW